MKNKIISIIFILNFFNSCTVSKNIKSNQTNNSWKAEFEELNGKEELNLTKQANSTVYLSSKIIANTGSLKLLANQKEILNSQKVNHTKLELDNNLKIQIIGQNANGSFSLDYPIYENKKINIQYNKNIELLALASFLIYYDDYASIPDEQSLYY